MLGLDHKESWAPKNWCFKIVVLEKTLESPLGGKEIQPVNPKGNQSWVFIGRTDVKAETPTLWPPDANIWLLRKDSDTGKDWRHEEKGTTENEVVGWHHQFDGHEFKQALRVGNEQGSLVCCSPWRGKSRTRLSNWTELTVATSKNDITNVYKASLKQFSIWTSPKQKQYPMDWFFPCWASNWITTEFYLSIQMQ